VWYNLFMTISKRQSIGQRTGVVGVVVNFGLFVSKLLAGLASNSIAIMADSFNNLADCGTGVASVFGFRFGARRGDESHPYGHGRMEYIAGLVVSIVIFVTAFSVGEAAVRRIFAPEPVAFSWLAVGICAAAIMVKIGLAVYFRQANKAVKSETLNASLTDSVTDTLATIIALLSLILAPLTQFPLDGILGIVVALFIAVAGVQAFSANLMLSLGVGLTKAERAKISRAIRQFEIFEQAEDLRSHDYGPESRILLARVRLAHSPHSQHFEKAMRTAKQALAERFGFEEVVIYWPPSVHKSKEEL
jgi:cation diffusion facilitator family transporter